MPEEAIADTNRAYQNTYVGLKKDNKIVPFLVEVVLGKVDERAGEEVPVFTGKAIGAARSETVPADKLDLKYPMLGVVNVGKAALYFTRIPERQWRRGFFFDNVRHVYVAHEVQALAQVEDPFKKDKDSVVSALFSPEYFNVREAINAVRTGQRAVAAINNRFWIGVAPFQNVPVIGYKNFYVGTLGKDDKVVLHKHATHVKEELAMYMEVK